AGVVLASSAKAAVVTYTVALHESARGQVHKGPGVNMRKISALLAGVVLASSAKAAVVTYTVALHESATGALTTANQFAIYATVSQGDNAGLFAYGID